MLPLRLGPAVHHQPSMPMIRAKGGVRRLRTTQSATASVPSAPAPGEMRAVTGIPIRAASGPGSRSWTVELPIIATPLVPAAAGTEEGHILLVDPGPAGHPGKSPGVERVERHHEPDDDQETAARGVSIWAAARRAMSAVSGP